MQCRAAQQRIDQEVRASTDPALAVHLAYCATCRADQERADARLLMALLNGEIISGPPQREGSTADTPPHAPPTPHVPPTPRGVSTVARRAGWLRPTGWVLIGIVVVWLGFMAGRVAFAAYTIQRNIAAMQVAPTPVLRVPEDQQPSVPAPIVAATELPALDPPPLPTLAPAPLATAVIPTDPADLPPTPVRPPYQPSATPVQLPAVDGTNPDVVTLPTLIPVAAAPMTASNATQPALTVLLLGSDRRPGEGWGTRSDAIIVARIDPARQRIALLSLPRDLIVPIPGYGSARVNAATVYGDLYPELGGSSELARRTISEYLGVPIDHVVRADFNAFVRGIDAIGGIEILVEQELYDPLYPTINYGYQAVYFAPGPNRMDGATALIYSRVRHMDSNYARNRRQQQVILAILNQVRTQDLLSQVETIADLTTALRDDIQTDLSLEQMVGLAWAMRGITPEMVERYAIDEQIVSEGVLANDPYATFANPGAVAELARLLMNGP